MAASVKTASTPLASELMDRHHQHVIRISEKVKAFYDTKTSFRIYHGSTNSTRNYKVDPSKIVDTSKLNRVITVDKIKQTAVVEPNVPMDKLVDATLKYGLVPPVVPEFRGITVGGAFSGTAGESSSFKHGFFDRTVNWCEMVLADGQIVRASEAEREDLFNGAAGAFGTLGVTTLFEIQLHSSSPYVEVTYTPVRSAAEAISMLRKSTTEPHDFIDGILFSRHRGIIVTGRLATTPSNLPARKPRRFSRAHDQWFYLHTGAAARRAQPSTDLVPLRDYLFRYDRGAFWMGTYAFHHAWLPFDRFTRFVLDPLMRTRRLYAALHHSGQAQLFVIQDVAMPAEAGVAESFVEWVAWEQGIWPLWLCPLRGDARGVMQRRKRGGEEEAEGGGGGDAEEMLVNVGVWGAGRGYDDKPFEVFKEDNRRLERKVKELGGTKWLYAHSYYTEEEFWDIYDREAYEALRDKYGAGSLPGVWEKVRSKDEAVKPTEFRAACLAMLGRDFLLKRTA